MHRPASLDPARTPWASNFGPEPGDVQRLVVRADGVEGLVPGRQDLAGGGVEVVAGCLVPDGQLVALEPHDVGGGPPDLVVGGGDDLPQVGAGDGAADRDVRVRGEPLLRFDGGEVLDVVAEVAAQVLDEPVEQRREVDRVPRGPLVVVGRRVGRGAVRADFAVAVAGEGEEHRRPVGLAVRGGVDLPGGAVGHRPAWAGRGRPGGGGSTGAAAGCLLLCRGRGCRGCRSGELVVELGDELVELGGVARRWRWRGRGGAGRRRAVSSQA